MDNNGLMERLKDSTRAMHDSAESSQFQGLLATGALPKTLYIDYLCQLYLVHSLLEKEIRKHQESAPDFAGVVSPDQLQEPFLRQDLDNFGRAIESIKALASTEKLMHLMAEFSEKCPVALLGMHYVLLGSKHGGKFIAKSCQHSYNLDDGRGVMYFDPYGGNFMPLWKAFKESMNTMRLTEAESDMVCSAASKMFSGVSEIGNELMPLAKI